MRKTTVVFKIEILDHLTRRRCYNQNFKCVAAEQTCLSLTSSRISNDRFLMTWLIWIWRYCNAVGNFRPSICVHITMRNMMPYSRFLFLWPRTCEQIWNRGADPAGVRVASFLHSISWTNGWILTKLPKTHYWDREKKWLDFDDIDLIFMVTPALWNFQILTKNIFSAPHLLYQMTDSGQTSHIVTLGWFKDLILVTFT